MKETAFLVTTDLSKMDVDAIHQFLSTQSTWAKGISHELVVRSLQNSLCFAGFIEHKQIAFARVISDYATFANLVDVFVLPEYRGEGFSKRLLTRVMTYEALRGLRRFTLATADAHGLYRQFGFTEIAHPQHFMERYDPMVYTAL